ncbi:MAG: RluA family pseudouridine synthase [Myxococcota bacterium]
MRGGEVWTISENKPTIFSFVVGPDDVGERLDIFLRDQDDPPLSRSQVKKCLNAGEITVNDEHVKAGYWLKEDDLIRWEHQPPREPDLEAQAIPIEFLYEDEHVAVVFKPAGMVVHPSPGHPDGTLVNALLHHMDDLAGIGGELRPGIVHRIDKDTSGALAVTKSDNAHRFLAKQFRDHSIDRKYHALVFGPGLDDKGTFETMHTRDPNNRMRYTGRLDKGRHAVTHYQVLERFNSGTALVECWLETGRTHQIRMHFFEANCPLLGDDMYGGKVTSNASIIDRQALHARSLGFDHIDGSRVDVVAGYPEDFQTALDKLRAGKEWR